MRTLVPVALLAVGVLAVPGVAVAAAPTGAAGAVAARGAAPVAGAVSPAGRWRPSRVVTIPLGLAAPPSTPPSTATSTATSTTGAAPALLADSGRRPAAPFSMVGVSWRRGSGSSVSFQVRVRTSGRWTAWSSLPSDDAAPDAGRPDDRASDRSASEPLWVGNADGVQVQAFAAGRRPSDVRVELIDPGSTPTDAAVAAAPATSTVSTAGRVASGTLSAAVAAAPGTAPAIIARSAWGADESLRSANPGCGTPEYGTTVKMGFVHHTAGSNSYGPADSAAIVRSIYAYHVQSNHWCDVGYNFLVDRFGRIFEGRYGGIDRPVVGAHTGGFNTDTFAASMMGDFTTATPPAAMLDAMANLYAWKLGSHYRDPLGSTVLTAAAFSGSRYATGTQVTFRTISGHRDADLTDCPGNAAYALLPSLRTQVNDRLPRSPIGARWNQLGGPSSALGQPTIGERAVSGGLITQFEHGALTWSSATGVHGLDGEMLAHYLQLGGPGGVLAFPTIEETSTPDGVGRFIHFSRGGSIYWTPGTGAHAVYGSIRVLWAATGWERGRLGYPTTDESGTPDGVGRFNHFSRGGSIYWTPGTGARAIYGAIRAKWAALGWERGRLGYPVTSEYEVPGGRRNDFQHGSITWTAATGAVEVIYR